MTRSAAALTVPAYVARTQFGSLLKQASELKARFIITKSGKPTAVLLSITDFDDMLEELDPEFRRSLGVAAKEYRGGKASSRSGGRRLPARPACRRGQRGPDP